jgi:acyl carrier protein
MCAGWRATRDSSHGQPPHAGRSTIIDASKPAPPPADDAAGTNPAALHVAEICSVIIGADVLPGTDLFSYGLTSLTLVRLVGAIDRAYGIRLTTIDIHDHPTASGLARLVGDRAAYDPHG